KRKPLFDDDDEDVTSKAKAADGGQEIGELNFEDTLAPMKESEKLAPRPKLKGVPAGPPTRKPKAREGDPTVTGNSASTREADRRAKEALELDASVYEYDRVYDALHAKSAAKKATEREDTEQGKSKYMDKLFEQAETRKKDQLRAKDKLLKREREAEGDAFADKEKFVTGAYKAQQEEVKKAEEEEKKRQEAEEERRKKFGMQNFHKQMLMEQEKRHQEAVEAAAEAMKSGVKVEVEEEPKEKTDAELARELSEKGQKVVLNEEGQVVDRRELLQAGLNIVAKPKSTSNTSANQKPATAQPKYQGRSAVQRGVRERQTQMISEQIEQAAKRKAEEEAEELAKLQQANKSQKTSDDIKSAKERYLERKRQKEAAAKAA
ncbi:hypothetical protein BS50DRAFT_467815, partial [Corynespora cassiicola Philippines]